MKLLRGIFVLFGLLCHPAFAETLTVSTVTRPPFSMPDTDGGDTGFSIDLWNAIATELGDETEFRRVDSFGEMLSLVENGEVDAAIANISITASREAVMDFSQPVFESGLRILAPIDGSAGSVWSAIFSRDVMIAVAAAIGLLFGGGAIMWLLERKAQPYFQGTFKEAAFPSFWWALNLVVNGGFEERMPRTILGRMFAVVLVVSSLFIVSIFVAQITTVMTVEAIQSKITGVNDLYEKRVGTIQGSTADQFLDRREVTAMRYEQLESMYAALENGELDAVVFDAPILAWYAQTRGAGKFKLVGNNLVPENYGIILPSGSELREQINRSLLTLRENGTYDAIYRDWFGAR